MSYYLATISLEITQYEGETTKSQVIRLVKASSLQEAESKAIQHYEGKTEQYSVYYNVRSCEVEETIGDE